MKATEVPKLEIQTPVVAHLGALDWLPNQEGLLWFINKVWPRLREVYPDIEFHIAGRNAPNWFEKKLNIDGVKFHGEIDDAEDFLKSYPVHIVPLFSGSGMRIKIVEAMAYGRAVVTTTLGTEGIDTENDVNILISDSDYSFADCIIKLIENNAYCREIGENAFTFVKEKLNNDKLVAELLDFVGKTL
jgi:glycosyltransferase involved in cell wall biosynthesis